MHRRALPVVLLLVVAPGAMAAAGGAAHRRAGEPASALAADASNAILGKWKDEDYGAIVEVTRQGEVFTGRILSTPLEGVKPGTVTFRGLRYARGDDEWVGRVYAPNRDSTYDATWRIDEGQLAMKVTFGPFWKTVMWSRP